MGRIYDAIMIAGLVAAIGAPVGLGVYGAYGVVCHKIIWQKAKKEIRSDPKLKALEDRLRNIGEIFE